MSTTMFVMLKKEKMPSPQEWSNAIKESGYGLQIDTGYDPSSESSFGFLPCKYYDADEIGYELDYVSRSEMPEDFEEWDSEFDAVRECDFAVLFGVYEDDDVNAAWVAGSVLAKISGGLFFDVDEPVELTEALETAFQIELEMKAR